MNEKPKEPEGYAEITVVVEGAFEEERTVPLNDEAAALDEIRRELEADLDAGISAEVFTIAHTHRPLEGDEECVCVQYLTSHEPEFVVVGAEMADAGNVTESGASAEPNGHATDCPCGDCARGYGPLDGDA